MKIPHFASRAGILCGVAAMAAVAVPALAQKPPEEITVTGRHGTVPESVKSLSHAVSYADLDLSTAAGKRELEHRVSLTARYLCDKLGESATSTPPVPSCRDAAVSDAMKRVGTLEANFAPRGTTWAAGSAWKGPYPEDWTKTYP